SPPRALHSFPTRRSSDLLADERTALTYAPQQPVFLMNVAYLYLRRSEYTQALEYLERAKRVAPEDPEVSKLAGWAYYGLNKLDQIGRAHVRTPVTRSHRM